MKGNGQKVSARQFRFTVVFLPVSEDPEPFSSVPKNRERKLVRRKSSGVVGYQVTVPVLPGLITFGRTLSEACEMAQDAVNVHIEGLRKAGEPMAWMYSHV